MIRKTTPRTSLLISGFSLIESAIVLAIVGLVIGGIWMAASTVRRNMELTRTSEAMLVTYQKAKELYSGQTSGGSGAVAAYMFPTDWVRNGYPVNPYCSGSSCGADAVVYADNIVITLPVRSTMSSSDISYCVALSLLLYTTFKNNFYTDPSGLTANSGINFGGWDGISITGQDNYDWAKGASQNGCSWYGPPIVITLYLKR